MKEKQKKGEGGDQIDRFSLNTNNQQSNYSVYNSISLLDKTSNKGILKEFIL